MVEPGYEWELHVLVPAPETSQFLSADKMLSWSAVFKEGMFPNGFSNHPTNKIWQPCWTCLPVLVLPSTRQFFHLHFMWVGEEIIRWGTGFVPSVVSMLSSHFYLKKDALELNSSNISRGHCHLPWLRPSSVWMQETTQQTDIRVNSALTCIYLHEEV